MLSTERKQINYHLTVLESTIEFNLKRIIIAVRRNVEAGLREARELGKRLGRRNWGPIARDVANCWPP
jgi:hypothetical protein